MSSQPGTDGTPTGSAQSASEHKTITPAMDRRNGLIFFISYLLIYISAPVTYVGIVQAALTDKLGAHATVANLPASAYFLGCLAPIFLTWVIPYRLERVVVVCAYVAMSLSMAFVGVTLVFPFGNSMRIGAVIGQALVMGFLGAISFVYAYQCLGRGTTVQGRAKALKLSFTFSPVAAVAGSLAAQWVLNRGIPFLKYPQDFAFLYFVGVPCMAGVALMSSRYQLVPVREEPRPPFAHYLLGSVRSYAGVRSLVVLWLVYAFWYATLSSMSNLSLYTRLAVGKDPNQLSGLIMALRFGGKALGGYALGALAVRKGVRAPLMLTILFVSTAILWVWIVPGYLFLSAFALMGAGELGGAYIPNYALAVSSHATGARDQSILSLATLAASISAAVHGLLTDHFGFHASFAFGGASALLSLWLATKLPSNPSARATAAED